MSYNLPSTNSIKFTIYSDCFGWNKSRYSAQNLRPFSSFTFYIIFHTQICIRWVDGWMDGFTHLCWTFFFNIRGCENANLLSTHKFCTCRLLGYNDHQQEEISTGKESAKSSEQILIANTKWSKCYSTRYVKKNTHLHSTTA